MTSLYSSQALCAPTSTELKNAISNAKGFIDRLYEELNGYAFVKEYPAFPITVKIVESNYVVQIGTSFSTNPTLWDTHSAYFTCVSRGIGSSIYYVNVDFEFTHKILGLIDYSHTWIHFYLETTFGGSATYYYVKINGIEGFGWTYETQTYEIYLGTEKIATVTRNSQFPIEILRYKSNYNCYPSHRYTVRHGSQLADIIYRIWGTPKPLDKVINDYGFTYDIYDPIFGLTYDNDDFMFTTQAYRDVDVYGSLPRGIHHYPYWSKVGLDRSLYIMMSHYDPLLQCLWAIHILNKYNNPDRYSWLGYVGEIYTSPRELARSIEATYWNGYGIHKPYSDSLYASGVRSAVFLVLETLLGYKYGDQTSRYYADTLAQVIVNTQFWYGYVETEYGVILRPAFRGAFPLSWKTGSSYPYALPPKSFLEQIVDMFNMPNETWDIIPSNTETTATLLQALRVYLYYKYGIAYPSSLYLP